MNQLELRFYTRAEIAEVLSVRLKGNNNFKRDVENKLTNSCYGYRYIDRQGVEILSKPEAPKEKLTEILYRGFGIDIQINPVQFACFIAAFTDIKDFSSMPWEERAKKVLEYYGYSVDASTLKNWCRQLIDRGVIAKFGCSTAWRTYFDGDRKIREPIEEIDRVEMESYYERRTELFKDHYISLFESGLPLKEARKEAWKFTYIDLWSEFECCFYYCKTFELSCFSYNEVDMWEIYELAREIAAPPPPQNEVRPPTHTNQEEFVF